MSKWIVEENNPAEKYSDGAAIEQTIFDYVKQSKPDDFETVLAKDGRWPVNYHLSPVREDIVSWYDFSPDADVLEIGAGMGAVTGALCRAAKTVTCVELTVARAQVLYERHKQYDNLTVRVGNFNRMAFEQAFDVITLIGVFEYAQAFTEDGDPRTFLNRIRGLLKPGGKLLLAIENRFGLKYWCGANEDHLAKPYVGIRGYTGAEKVRTYSRAELSDILTECGFVQQQYFYPLPDYKFPLVIYSDRTLPEERLSDKVKDYYIGKPILMFRERGVLPEIVRNGAFPFMANSFLVECACGGAEMTSISYASFTPERQMDKRVITRFRGKETVEKLAALPQGSRHIETMLSIQDALASDLLTPYRCSGGILQMPLLEGKRLDLVLISLMEAGKIQEAEALIHRFSDCIDSIWLQTVHQERVGLIDLVFQNCMLSEEGFRFFDQEWVLPGATKEYILYRSIHALYHDHSHLEALFPEKQLLNEFQISKEQAKQFYHLDAAFYANVLCQDYNSIDYLDHQTAIYTNVESALSKQIFQMFRRSTKEVIKKTLRPVLRLIRH